MEKAVRSSVLGSDGKAAIDLACGGADDLDADGAGQVIAPNPVEILD
jgi:hypothetical protein